MSAHTGSCEWKGSKSRIPEWSFVERQNTNLAGAQNMTRVDSESASTKDASLQACSIGAAHRLPLPARLQTSFCSGRPGLRKA
jgi:hypothetical protein